MTPFTIRSWKEKGEIRLEFGGANFSRAQCASSFWAFEKELKEKNHYAKLTSKNEGELLLMATIPEIEPYETVVEINADGFSLDEIWSVVETANKGLVNYFNSNGL